MRKNKTYVRLTAAATLVALSLITEAAFAVYEAEPNDDIGHAQLLVIGPGGTVEITAALGALSGTRVDDFDFYSFDGKQGDVVTIDIDGGMKPAGSTSWSVDTYVAIFGPGPSYLKLRENDDVPSNGPIDPGSDGAGLLGARDALITNFTLPATGRYTVGVSSFPRYFTDGGVPTSHALGSQSNGSYTLTISGISPALQQISIDIKPGSRAEVPLVRDTRGVIPVALLSSPEFDALQVDQSSLTFGVTGAETSFVRCLKRGYDVDGDGRMDLVCLFDNQTSNFEPVDLEGVVKGMNAGRSFEGRGRLKVVPEKRRHHEARGDRDDWRDRYEHHERHDRHDERR